MGALYADRSIVAGREGRMTTSAVLDERLLGLRVRKRALDHQGGTKIAQSEIEDQEGGLRGPRNPQKKTPQKPIPAVSSGRTRGGRTTNGRLEVPGLARKPAVVADVGLRDPGCQIRGDSIEARSCCEPWHTPAPDYHMWCFLTTASASDMEDLV